MPWAVQRDFEHHEEYIWMKTIWIKYEITNPLKLPNPLIFAQRSHWIYVCTGQQSCWWEMSQLTSSTRSKSWWDFLPFPVHRVMICVGTSEFVISNTDVRYHWKDLLFLPLQTNHSWRSEDNYPQKYLSKDAANVHWKVYEHEKSPLSQWFTLM